MLLTKKTVRPLVFLIVLVMAAYSAFAVETTDSANKIDPKEIQKALTDAGFYKGTIDGVLGTKSKDAIRKFQEANGLKVDGVCGPQTWEKLKAYAEEAAAIDASNTVTAATTANATATTTSSADAAAVAAAKTEEQVASTPAVDEEEVSYDYGYSEYDNTAEGDNGALKQKLVS